MANLLTRRVLLQSRTKILKDFGRRWASGTPEVKGLDSRFVARPSLMTMAYLVSSGNSIIPGPPGLDTKEFVSGTHLALGRTTEILSSEDINDHPDLFSAKLRAKLGSNISLLDSETRKNLLVSSEDIFFTWINGIEKTNDGGTSVKVVTMSFPRFGEMRRNVNEKNEIEKELREEAKELISRQKDLKIIKENIASPQVKDLNHRRAVLLSTGEIVIANMDFHRDSESSPWVIQDFAMKESRLAHTQIGCILWKFRLKVAIETQKDFSVFLRFDYFTNFLILVGIFVSSWFQPH